MTPETPPKPDPELAAVVQAAARFPDSPYWARRLVELMRSEAQVSELREPLLAAALCWITHDPRYFASQSHLTSSTHLYLWPKDLLAELDARLSLEDASIEALIKGKIWMSARLRRHDDPELPLRASRHLLAVGESLRDANYYHDLCDALAVTDYPRLKEFAGRLLDSAIWYRRSAALHVFLSGAAEHGDWTFYDEHRAAYRDLEKAGQTRGYADCQVLNLDGRRALALGHLDELPQILRALLDRGHNVDFLGAPQTMVLVRLLVERGLCLELCRDYVRLVQKQGPAPKLQDLLAEIEKRMEGIGPRRS